MSPPRTAREHAASRVRELALSPTLAMSERARVLRASGHDVIDLATGEPELPTPEHVRRAAETALEAGQTRYGPPAGLPALRRAIADKLLRENGLSVDPTKEVLVTPGGKAALFEALCAFVEPGREVIVLDPSWVSFAPMVALAGGRPVRVALDADQGFKVTAAALGAAATERTRVLLVNSPNNPTGRVLDAEELEAIRALAVERDLLVFSDEIYERVVYDGRRHTSPATLPGMAARTLTFNGFSKAYAMTGWRLGYVAGPAPLLEQVLTVHSHSITCVPTFLQAGAVAALEGPQDGLAAMVQGWAQRRAELLSALASVPGVRCPAPQGAFYAFVDLRGRGVPSVQLATELLEETRLVAVPGAAFGEAGEGHLRLSFALSQATMTEAIRRLTRWLSPS